MWHLEQVCTGYPPSRLQALRFDLILTQDRLASKGIDKHVKIRTDNMETSMLPHLHIIMTILTIKRKRVEDRLPLAIQPTNQTPYAMR